MITLLELPYLIIFLINSFLYFILYYLFVKKKPYLIVKLLFYLAFLLLILLVNFTLPLFYLNIEKIINILHTITQNPLSLIISLGVFTTLFTFIAKGGIWLKEKIKPLKIDSILFRIASDEAEFEREIKGLEPYYDDRISAEDAESYLRTIPIEIRNNTNSTIVFNSIFLEVFKPINKLHKIRYIKINTKFTNIMKDLNLPVSIKPKDSYIFKVSTGDIIFIGETNSLRIKKPNKNFSYSYVYYPKMRFSILYDRKTYYSPKFDYNIVWRFFRIIFKTFTRKSMEKIAIEMIKKRVPAPQLVDEIEKFYLKTGYPPPAVYFNCYDDLLFFLKNHFPTETSYIEEVNKRLSLLERKFYLNCEKL